MLKLLRKKKIKIDPLYANDLVGCVGKLPIHREFIKHRVVLPELARLDNWYQSAYHALSRTLGAKVKTSFLKMPIHYYYSYAGNQAKPMIGSLMASKDQSGRVYPYVLFRILENPVAMEFRSTIALLYKDYYQAANKINKLNWQNTALPEVFSMVNNLQKTTICIPRKIALEVTLTQLQRLAFNNFWQAIRLHRPSIKLSAFVQALIDVLKHIEKINILRLPLFSGENAAITVVFWLQLIDSFFVNKEMPMQLFWHQNEGATLTIFFQFTCSNPLMYLVDGSFVDANIVDLLDSASKITNLSVRAEEIASKSSLSLLETLRVWGDLCKSC